MLSLAKVTPEMGAHYFSKEDYYSQEKGPAKPEFLGKGCSKLGIKSDFNQITFQELIKGKSPIGFDLRQRKRKAFSEKGRNSYKYIQRKLERDLDKLKVDDSIKNTLSEIFQSFKSKHHLNKNESKLLENKLLKELPNQDHKAYKKIKKCVQKFVNLISKESDRAGLDLTFSAPKSVSIATLISGDKNLLDAHKEAVKFTLNYIENNYIGTRVGPKHDRKFVKTQNMIASLFHHGTSRLQDPQLHTHCVVINSTYDSSGKWKAIHNDGIYKDSVLLGTIYQKKLADLVMKQGYEVIPEKNGTFQLAGYTEDQIAKFSKRSSQIQEVLDKELMSNNAKSKREAVLINRRPKITLSPNELKEKWNQEAKDIDIVHPKKQLPMKKSDTNWKFATMHLKEKNSVWTNEKLLLATLQANIKNGNIEEILKNYEKKSEVKIVNSKGIKIGLTNNEIIQTEKEILNELWQGRSKFDAIAEYYGCESLSKARNFTLGQSEAFKLSMTNKDFISAWIGVAGSGKSYALKDVKRVATEQGYEVIGLGPDGNTAKELSKATEIKALTIDKFLLLNKKNNQKKKLLIIDEAGKVPSNKMLKIIQKAKDYGDSKILLVGDTRQTSAVEAGSPFTLLLNNGIAKAELLEHRRQQNYNLKKVVEMASKKELVQQSVKALDSHCIALKTRKSRIKKIVNMYLELSEDKRRETLILTDLNKDRIDLTKELRSELKNKQFIGKKDHKISILRQKDLSEVQKMQYWSYSIGDIIIPFKDIENTALKKDYQYTIEKINKRTGKITLKNRDFYTTISPKKTSELTLYSEDNLNISSGDKLQFTKNYQGNTNREIITVDKIQDDKLFYKESKLPINLIDNKQFLDHAIVQTTYSSQGQTCENVIFMAESNISKETWYVGISRAKKNVEVITDNIDKLSERVIKSHKKVNALDFDLINKQQIKQKENPSYGASL